MTSIARETGATPPLEEVARRAVDCFAARFGRELVPDPELALAPAAGAPA